MEHIAAGLALITPIIGIILVIIYNNTGKKTVFIALENDKCVEKEYLPKEVAYERYEEISAQKSVKNSVVRNDGDFLDFLLAPCDTMNVSEQPESNLSSISCGEYYA